MKTTSYPARLHLLIPALSALTLGACSTFKADTPTAGPVPGERTNPVFSEPLVKTAGQLAPRDLATLIFLRPGRATAAAKDAPLNVYVNGRYLASLLPGGYVEHRNCAGTVPVAAVFDDARIRHLGQRGQAASVGIEAGKTYYFRVESAGADQQAKVTPLTVEQVSLSEYRRQSHALARAPACLPAAAASAVAATAVPAAPVLASAAPAATPAAAGWSAEQVRAPLEAWRAAWERGDYAAYQSFYAPNFKGTLASRKAWEAQRRARLNNAAKQITLDNIVLAAVAGDGSATADFQQRYQSKGFTDQGQKRLVWKLVGGMPKIVGESFTGR